jgi:hypothetical protein
MAAITFLMDDDSSHPDNPFYANAKGFFKQTPGEIVDSPAGGQTLEGVFKVLRDKAAETPPKIYDPINIVSHASGFSSFEFRLRASATSDVTMADDVTAEIVKINAKAADAWKQLGPPIIVPATRVVLYGCDVGRGAPFLESVALLFGDALHIYAPLRVAVFRHVGTVFQYRLARTWSVPWPTNITSGMNWVKTRADFLVAADKKFGAKWILVKPVAGPSLQQVLTPIAQTSTAAIGATWFFGERLTLDVADAQNPQADINQLIPMHSAILTGGNDVDDTTVENVVGPAQVTHKIAPKQWAAEILGLAQIIDKDVDITDTDQYRHCVLSPAKAPSAGPTPPPNTPPVVPPAHSSLFDQARDELIAAGVSAGEIDAAVAAISPSAETELDLPEPDPPIIEGLDRPLAAEDFV